MNTTTSSTLRLPRVGPLLLAQTKYQARLLASGRAVTIGVGLPVILLIASSSQHVHPGPADTAGYAVFGLTLTAWNTYGVRLVAARESGILKRWRATPLPRWAYFLARITATVVVAALAGAATVLASVALYQLHLTVEGALTGIAVLILGGLAWSAPATALTAAIPTVEAAAPVLMLIYFPIVIISQVLGSTSEPHWLTTLANYLPAHPLANLLLWALTTHHGSTSFPIHDVVVLGCWALGGLALAITVFQWEPNRPANRQPNRQRPIPVAR